MGDLPVRDPESKERIGGRDQDPPIARLRRGGPSDSHPPAPPGLPGSRVQRENLTPLGFGYEHPTHHGHRSRDRTGGYAPDSLAIAPAQRVNLAVGTGCRHEDRVARQEYAPDDHSRKAGRPAYLTARQIHRVDLPVHASHVQRVLSHAHLSGELPAGSRGPDRGGSIAGRRGGNRRRWRSEIHAARVDASQEEG